MSMLAHGACMGYADPKTLSSTGAIRKMPDGTYNREATGFGNCPPGAIQEFAPTILAAVPKIWDIFKKGMEAKVGATSGVVQGLMQTTFVARSWALQQGTCVRSSTNEEMKKNNNTQPLGKASNSCRLS